MRSEQLRKRKLKKPSSDAALQRNKPYVHLRMLKIGTCHVMHMRSVSFSHPDYTVGPGIAPGPPSANRSASGSRTKSCCYRKSNPQARHHRRWGISPRPEGSCSYSIELTLNLLRILAPTSKKSKLSDRCSCLCFNILTGEFFKPGFIIHMKGKINQVSQFFQAELRSMVKGYNR